MQNVKFKKLFSCLQKSNGQQSGRAAGAVHYGTQHPALVQNLFCKLHAKDLVLLLTMLNVAATVTTATRSAPLRRLLLAL